MAKQYFGYTNGREIIRFIWVSGHKVPIYAAKPLDDDIAGGPGTGYHKNGYDEEALHDNAYGGEEPLDVAKPYDSNKTNQDRINDAVKKLPSEVDRISKEVDNIAPSNSFEDKHAHNITHNLLDRIDSKINYANALIEDGGDTKEIQAQIAKLRGLRRRIDNGN